MEENWQPSTSRLENEFLSVAFNFFCSYTLYVQPQKNLNGFIFNKRVEKIVANDITKVNNISLEHIYRQETLVGGWQI